jgi:hypothetical protein
MSETETILKNESGVKCFEANSAPSMWHPCGGGAHAIGVGTVIVTNLKLVYINKQGVGTDLALTLLVNPIITHAIEKKAGKADLDDATKLPGSFSIPLEGITRAEESLARLPSYLHVYSQSPSLKPMHTFIFDSRASSDDWVNAVNSAIAARSPQTSSERAPPPSVPATTSPSSSRYCVSCGQMLRPADVFCTRCGQKAA